jgi:3-hydroxybutyryl-CoA dehydrogenase
VSLAAGPSVGLEIRTVAVIGAGVAGRGFALACAAAGFDVVLEDVMPAKLRRAEAEYAELHEQSVVSRLELALTVEDAVREADVAVDFVPDELESKLEIFSMIDRMAPPKTILCTPTDALSISDLASCVYRPERCVAVRGTLERGGMVKLVYPVGVAEAVLGAMERFLGALGVGVERAADAEAPMLVKNDRSGERTPNSSQSSAEAK